MESPINFCFKEEPASPSWELELLNEVEGVWEGDVGVIDVVAEDEDNIFWGQDVSEFIGKEEQLLGLELDDIVLEEEHELKEEPFAGWLDSGSIYDGPAAPSESVLPPVAYSSQTPGLWTAPDSPVDEKPITFAANGQQLVVVGGATASADLLQEFEDVLSRAAAAGAGSLTPPDSPRSAGNGSSSLLQAAPTAVHLQPIPLSPSPGQGFVILQDMTSSPAAGEAELDELMAETIRNTGGTPATADLDVKGTLQTSGRPWDSPSASSSAASDSGYDDPDWSSPKSSDSSLDNSSPSKKLRLTSTEERRLRKKEQNKNAATRYRMKKKMEMEEIMGEEKELQDRHDSLHSEVVEITREIKYLKSLMGDLFRAKGLIRAK